MIGAIASPSIKCNILQSSTSKSQCTLGVYAKCKYDAYIAVREVILADIHRCMHRIHCNASGRCFTHPVVSWCSCTLARLLMEPVATISLLRTPSWLSKQMFGQTDIQ